MEETKQGVEEKSDRTGGMENEEEERGEAVS